jgi:hypothetical protein
MFVTRDPADVVTKGRKVHGRDDDEDDDDDGGACRGGAAFRFSLSEAHTEYIWSASSAVGARITARGRPPPPPRPAAASSSPRIILARMGRR